MVYFWFACKNLKFVLKQFNKYGEDFYLDYRCLEELTLSNMRAKMQSSFLKTCGVSIERFLWFCFYLILSNVLNISEQNSSSLLWRELWFVLKVDRKHPVVLCSNRTQKPTSCQTKPKMNIINCEQNIKISPNNAQSEPNLNKQLKDVR